MLKLDETNLSINFSLGKCIKNIAVAFAITILMLATLALIMTYTMIPENLLSVLVRIVTLVSILIAGLLCGVNTESRGWMSGSICGILYMIILYAIGAIAFGGIDFTYREFAQMAYGLIAGTLGGIIGVNIKHDKRR